MRAGERAVKQRRSAAQSPPTALDDFALESLIIPQEGKMNDNKPTPYCPYCGRAMKLEDFLGEHWYQCPMCESRSPVKRTSAEAHESAIRRAVLANRVLSLKEMENKKLSNRGQPTFFWTEDKGGTDKLLTWRGVIERLNNEERFGRYGNTWRCWLEKPTLLQKKETPWR